MLHISIVKEGERYLRWLAIFFLMIGSILVVVYETNASDRRFLLPEPLGGLTIVVDAGHGGIDGGASKGDVIESEITLKIAQRVERQLKRMGAKVIMTRTTAGDALSEHAPSEQFKSTRERKREDLFLRESIVQEAEADMFITIHANAIPNSKWRGAQIFYHKTGHPHSVHLANEVQGSIRESLQNTDREALAIEQVYLLKKVNMPAILVETGFISNDEERELLLNVKYQEQMADAIVRGIENYYSLRFE